jgi:hypothetical protein
MEEELIELRSNNRFFASLDPALNTFFTEIIEEGKIAYLNSGGGMLDIWQAQGQIRDFNQKVEEYEHLIIDLRANRGGDPNHFLDTILRHHITEPVQMPDSYHFFLDGPYVRRFGDMLFLPTLYSGNLTISEPYRPAHEILELFDLPEFHLPDLERLHYGAPSGSVNPIITPFDPMFSNPFQGSIWLLTGPNMSSAAQQVAWISMETGFATHVGETTGGCMGGPRTMVFMPNTGIIFYFDVFYITDSRGRPLEAGTIPHHFNHPGMDALETVLALIAEGEY